MIKPLSMPQSDNFIRNYYCVQKTSFSSILFKIALQWRHNELDSVSNHQPRHCFLNRLFGCKSKKTLSKLSVIGFCAGNSQGTGEFPAQMASNAENVSIWWRHHVYRYMDLLFPFSGSHSLTQPAFLYSIGRSLCGTRIEIADRDQSHPADDVECFYNDVTHARSLAFHSRAELVYYSDFVDRTIHRLKVTDGFRKDTIAAQTGQVKGMLLCILYSSKRTFFKITHDRHP